MVYLFFDRSIPEASRKQIVHDFRFMGFEVLGPSHSKLPVKDDRYLFMAYELDCESDESDLEED